MEQNLVVYSDGELELTVSVGNETIWLSQKQISNLFDKDIRTINDHIKAIYKDEELEENSTIRKFRIVQKEGNRDIFKWVRLNPYFLFLEVTFQCHHFLSDISLNIILF
ncbi:MAG: hypothetical protein ACOX39_09265 [Arcobacteraceae bacterium]|nr:hypothetical protein [Arcobacteraceae bacterium]